MDLSKIAPATSDRVGSLTRRGLLQAGGVAAGSAVLAACAGSGVATRPAVAEDAAAAAHAPRAFYRFQVGEMTLTSICDGGFTFPTAAFGINAPEGAVGKFLETRELAPDFASLQAHCLLVQSGGRTILLDTGMGPYVFPGNQPNNARLIPTLALLGIRPEAVDVVILSHGHPDHLGAAADANGTPSFPNARYYITREDWDFWTAREGDPENGFMDFMLKAANASLRPIENQLDVYKDGEEIVPGIRAVAAPGHTPGHSAFMITSGNERLLNMVDVAVHYVVALEQPEWVLAADVDPDQALATRRRILNQAADERIRVFAYHFPFPGVGHVLGQDRWSWLPTA